MEDIREQLVDSLKKYFGVDPDVPYVITLSDVLYVLSIERKDILDIKTSPDSFEDDRIKRDLTIIILSWDYTQSDLSKQRGSLINHIDKILK